MGKNYKHFLGEKFTVVGSRKTKKDARKLAKSTRKTHRARVLKNKDARGNIIYLVWASIRKKRK